MMNIKLYASLIAALVLNTSIPLCYAQLLSGDDVRGNVGNISAILTRKDPAHGNKSYFEIIDERLAEQTRVGNNDIAYLKRQIEYYKSSPEMVADFEKK